MIPMRIPFVLGSGSWEVAVVALIPKLRPKAM